MSEQQNNQVYNMDSTISLAALSAMSIDDKTSGKTDMAHVNAKTNNNSPANSHLSSGSALANSANSGGGSGIIEGSLTKLQQQHNDDGQQQYQQQQQPQHLQNQPQQFDQQFDQFQQQPQYDNQPQQQQSQYNHQPQQFDNSQQYIDPSQQYEQLQLPIITPEDLPPDMLEAFNSLEPSQQVQALEMLAQQQLLGTYFSLFRFVGYIWAGYL